MTAADFFVKSMTADWNEFLRLIVVESCPSNITRAGKVTQARPLVKSPPAYCGSIFASRIALAHLAVSSRLRWASASGVPGSTAKPMAANFS